MTKFVFMVVCFIYTCMAGIAKSNTTGTFTYSGAERGGSQMVLYLNIMSPVRNIKN